jgi:hypothetical protein
VVKEKMTYLETMNEHLSETVGDKYVPYPGPMRDGD